MGLADRLLEDTTLTVRGHLLGRRIGLGAGIFGLLIMILERRAVWATGDRFVLAGLGMPVLALGIVFFLLGAGAFVAFWFWPPARTLGVRLAESQAQEWEKVQEEARLWELLTWVGLGMLGGGALMAVIAYGALPDAQVVAVSSLMLVVAFAGGALLFAAFIRRQSLRRLYVQTLVLSRLEATGLGPGRMPEPIKAEPAKDRRVGPVLQALDELLGSLPDAAVNRFLSSDEAAAYLELIDEVNKSEDHDR